MQETERIEFKERLTDDIYKEIIAFANTDGGTIYVGINDHGEPVGLEDAGMLKLFPAILLVVSCLIHPQSLPIGIQERLFPK